jgi:putative transcriptional regulator
MTMTDKNTDFGDRLIASMGEALAHARGETTGVRETQVEVPAPAVRAIRTKMGLSQKSFAPLLGVSVSGLQKWEQGKRRPMGAAATLLHVMDQDPATVARALGTAKKAAGQPATTVTDVKTAGGAKRQTGAQRSASS